MQSVATRKFGETSHSRVAGSRRWLRWLPRILSVDMEADERNGARSGYNVQLPIAKIKLDFGTRELDIVA